MIVGVYSIGSMDSLDFAKVAFGHLRKPTVIFGPIVKQRLGTVGFYRLRMNFVRNGAYVRDRNLCYFLFTNRVFPISLNIHFWFNDA